MRRIVVGGFRMKAKEFNQRYPVGSVFIYQPNPVYVAVRSSAPLTQLVTAAMYR
jgi:hypothetical protein